MLHPKFLCLFASLLAALSVLVGAFGAHGAQKVLTPQLFKTFHTASTYLYYHTAAFFVLGILKYIHPQLNHKASAVFFLLGLILFCGGCFLYVLSSLKFFAHIVPLGGLSFFLGWVFLAFRLAKDIS